MNEAIHKETGLIVPRASALSEVRRESEKPIHYHGSRPNYPAEKKGRVTVRLANLDAARVWLQVWASRVSVAWPGQDDEVCLGARNSEKPTMRVGGREARVWPCENENCVIGIGVQD